MDLLRQRRQHPGRSLGLPEPSGTGQGAGPARRCSSRCRHDRRPGARYRQGGRRRHGLRAGSSLGRGADAEPLCRPHVHRGHGRPCRQGPAQVHAAARSPRRQARAPGRGQHRPLDDHAGPGARDSRPRRSTRDSPSRSLPADHRSLLLRHRHVAQGRALRDSLYRSPGRKASRSPRKLAWPRSSVPTACATCPSRPSPGPSASRAIASAAPASPAATRPRPVSSSTRSKTATPIQRANGNGQPRLRVRHARDIRVYRWPRPTARIRTGLSLIA